MSKLSPDFLNSVVAKFDDEFFWHLKHVGEFSELYVSENIEKVTGYSVESFKAISDKTRELIYEADRPDYRKAMDSFINDPTQNHIMLEYRIRKKDSSIIWVNEIMKFFRNSEGKVIEFFGKVKDITKIYEERQSLKKKIDELEETNKAKDNFISVLSHDLRAPFTSILGFSEILMNESSLTEREKSEYLTYINDSSQNQLQLINFLLDWSRLQTNRMKMEFIRLHAQSIVFNCVSILTGSAIRKNINIKVNIPENFYIEADERLINIVITNLLNNAIKYSREGSSVDITANYFSNNMVEFTVTDEGIGIPESNKEKIFLIKSIFSTPGTKGEKGTGLGLALTKQIIQKHGGDIWFYSNEGSGSEFHFTVFTSANTVLVIKQNEEEKQKIVNKLNEHFDDVEVITASNGFEALQIVEKSSPTLIITDHNLPLMSGLKFVESIRKLNKSTALPVIALLEKDAYELKKNYEDLGAVTVGTETVFENGLRKNIQMFIMQISK